MRSARHAGQGSAREGCVDDIEELRRAGHRRGRSGERTNRRSRGVDDEGRLRRLRLGKIGRTVDEHANDHPQVVHRCPHEPHSRWSPALPLRSRDQDLPATTLVEPRSQHRNLIGEQVEKVDAMVATGK